MQPLSQLSGFAIIGLMQPFVLVAATAIWYRYDRRRVPAWRSWAVAAGLLCAWAGLTLYGYSIYVAQTSSDDGVMWQENGDIATWLAIAGVLGAIAGKGIARGVLAVASIMGFLGWIVPGIL